MRKLISMFLVCILNICLLSGCKKADVPSVYYLNFKPEADSAWQELAKKYTDLTGVEVTVVTAAAGAYSETLIAEMDKANMPTLFQCGNQAALDTWSNYCLDLKDTKVYQEMTTDDFNLLGENGEVKAIGYCYECFGIIVNKALLARAGYDVSDITDFESLKNITEDITKRTDELGFSAFTSSGLDSSSSWRFSGHLANMPLFYEFRDNKITAQPSSITGTYLKNFKNIWDLYINNSTTPRSELTTKTSDESLSEFGEGKAVFFQNGSWEFSNLIDKYGMNPSDLAMIPIYIGVEGEENSALACGTENCWAVNSKASDEDIAATLDFIYWVVTSDEGTQMMAEQFGPIPFKNAKETDNVFFNDSNRYISEGKYIVTWAFSYTPNVDSWRSAVVAALTQYTVGNGSWEDVERAFINGWATQYANQ